MRFFNWDPAKAKSNLKKHGVRFQTAVQAFHDPFVTRFFDRIIGDEIRWHTIGMVDGHMLLLIVHTVEDDDGDELIRIISARKADRREEKKYVSENRKLGAL